MEKLLNVTELDNQSCSLRALPSINGSGGRIGILSLLTEPTMAGFKITTNENTYFLLISNDQNCCENWGYISSEDNFENFIGKEIIEILQTDKALNVTKLNESGYYADDSGGTIFVDFKFNDGSVLQFCVYNAHNGFYGHSIVFAKNEDIVFHDIL